MEKSRISSLHALLIGIDYYFPNRLPNGSFYPSLRGCVRDIEHVEDFLIRVAGMDEENILKFSSSSSKDGALNEPVEAPEKWPTYENIVAAFDKITVNAQAEDQVYIHYSGHGGRIETLIPEIKGKDGLDETLVPTDIGNTNTRYLRDIEIAHFIQKMIEKKLIITLVLDSCHSGGATRGFGGATVRGTNIVDTTQRPLNSIVASIEELSSTWKKLLPPERPIPKTIAANRNLESNPGSGWFPEPRGYVLLAACRPSESAYEYSFEGDESNGALTYWLLKSLSHLDDRLTYKLVHDRIVAKVHSQFPLQTPMLEGEGDRKIFGSERAKPVYTANVMKTDPENNLVLLNAGQVHGVRKGTKFAVYQSGFTDLSQVEKRLAIVELQERGSTTSWAKISTSFGNENVEPGAQAVLIDPVEIHLKRQIGLAYQPDLYFDESIGIDQEQALNQIKEHIKSSKSGWLELADHQKKMKADFQVAVSKNGYYEIWDPGGNIIPNLTPGIKIGQNNSVSQVIQRLIHLAKYNNVQQIDNLDPASPLSGNLVVELLAVSPDYDPADKPDLFPLESEGNIKMAKVGQKLVLRVRNNLPKDSKTVLNVTILDLQPDWGIRQIYPSNPGANFIPIDPDHEQLFPLRVDLPSNYVEGKDIIKTFATIDQANFRWLELSSLDQTSVQKNYSRGNLLSNSLEEMMAAMTVDKPISRDLLPSATPSKEWTTSQIEVHITR
jgi:hypothetical protein